MIGFLSSDRPFLCLSYLWPFDPHKYKMSNGQLGHEVRHCKTDLKKDKGKTKQDKTRQDKTRQDKTKARQDMGYRSTSFRVTTCAPCSTRFSFSFSSASSNPFEVSSLVCSRSSNCITGYLEDYLLQYLSCDRLADLHDVVLSVQKSGDQFIFLLFSLLHQCLLIYFSVQ